MHNHPFPALPPLERSKTADLDLKRVDGLAGLCSSASARSYRRG
jgi:hypothetical protein